MLDIREKISSFNNILINLNYKTILIVMISGMSFYFGTIFFVFIPTEEILFQEGYTIFDFQMSWYNQNTDVILQNWSGIIDVVVYQIIMDYFFIIGGMLFLGSIYILLIKITSNQRIRSFLLIGFWFVDIGAILDAFENIISLLILFNLQNYPRFFVFFLSIFATLKFIILFFEYGIIIFAVILILVKERTQLRTKLLI
ncbi:MAG: hypothetical protein ACXACX_06415 [Candidatus Hodarchaeales archaeon]